MSQGNGEYISAQTALVLVDIQNDFVNTSSNRIASVGKSFCVPGAQRILDYARTVGWRVLHVGTLHESEETIPKKLIKKGYTDFCRQGSFGSNFVLTINENECVVYKKHFSAFFGTNILAKLKGIERIIVGGISADCCVLKTVFDANENGFDCLIAMQAVSASRVDDFCHALHALSKSACEILDIDALVVGNGFGDSIIPDGAILDRSKSWYNNQIDSLV